jgi:hypothetical protein
MKLPGAFTRTTSRRRLPPLFLLHHSLAFSLVPVPMPGRSGLVTEQRHQRPG